MRMIGIAVPLRRPRPTLAALAAFLAGLHLLLFTGFILSAVVASKALSADDRKCGGSNLLARLELESPEKYAKIRAEASAIANGRNLLWKIEKGGNTPSYLFGTMHSPDERIARLEGRPLEAFSAATTVVVESVEALDPSAMQASVMKMKEMVFLPDGSSLETLLPHTSVVAIRTAAEARGLPWIAANRMQPWMLAAAIARPNCEIAAASSGSPVLDKLIVDRATAEGKELASLESIEDQFASVASVPRDFHINALTDLAELGELADDISETTKILYLEGDTATILPLVRAYSPRAYAGKGGSEFQELLIEKRNLVMAERAIPVLENGGAFIAIGALHLPGAKGVVELLRSAGYSVQPVTD